MNRYKISTIFIVLIVIFASGSFANDTVRLTMKFQKGQFDKYRMTMKTTIKMPDMPGVPKKPIVSSVSMTMNQRVVDIYSDGSAKIRTSYSNISMDSNIGVVPKNLNLASEPITYVIFPDGRLKDIYGMENLAGNISEFDFSGIINQMNMSSYFPQRELIKGDSWTIDMPIPWSNNPFYMISTILSTNESVNSITAAKIQQSFKGNIDIGEMMKNIGEAAAAQTSSSGQNSDILSMMSNMISSINGEVNLKGWNILYFSPNLGRMLKSNGVTEGDITIFLPKQATNQGMPSKLKMDLKINVDVKRI
ncbi:MAG: hypothetical protein SNJ70_11120 [Armatimonadota bacterium]